VSASGYRGGEGCAPDAAPYVLGALTEQEHAAFLVHLESCAVCREEVAALQIVADVLPAAAPQMKAPPELRARIMAGVSSEPALEERLAASRTRTRTRASWWRAFERPALAFAGLAAVAAALALAVIAIAGGGGASTRVIRAEARAPGASVALLVRDGRAQLQISGMPASAPGRVYEVWLKRGGAPQPTDALFTVTSYGTATVGVPGDIAGVKAVLVSSEPLGGSTVPTTVPLIVAHIS